MASVENISVVIDIGTAKIAALAGRINELGKIEILASAISSAKGIKRGVIFNLEEATVVISGLISSLEKQLDQDITMVHVAFAGQYMKTISYQNAKYTSDEGIVTKFDIDHLYNEAKKTELEQAYEIVQVIPTSFSVDNEQTELNPVGITGREIVANYKLVVMPEPYVKNLQRVMDKVGVDLGEIMLSNLAVAEAVITEDEKEMGAVVLDIGSGTTKLSVFYENMLIHTAVIPFGGSVITRDIKEGCAILLKWAEQLKVKYGQALGDFADDQKYVTIPVHSGMEPKEISFRSLAYIIQARLEEIMDSVNAEVEKSEISEMLGAGIVLTGGTAKLDNIISLVKFRTGMDARIANLAFTPLCDKKLLQDPGFYTCMGLLNLCLHKEEIPVKETRKKKKKKKESGGITLLDKVMQGAFGFFDDDSEDMPLN